MGGAKTRTGRDLANQIKKDAEARQRRERVVIIGGLGIVVLVLIALTVVGIRNASDPDASPKDSDLKSVSGLGKASTPPWALPADVPDRVQASGLNLGRMGTAEHYHAHLDIIIDGKPVQVPENIGIDPSNGAMSGLHTHSSDGIVHVEATTKGQPFTIGQLFTQWNVRLADDQIGSLRAGDGQTLKAYVNGKEVTGNPAMIQLSKRQQVALVFGPADSPVKPPAEFDFPSGL